LASQTPIAAGAYGFSVDLGEIAETLIVGEPGAAAQQGAAHVYTCAVPGGCAFSQTLTGTGAIAGNRWGTAVAIEDATLPFDVVISGLNAGTAGGGKIEYFTGGPGGTIVSTGKTFQATSAGTQFGIDVDLDRIGGTPDPLVIAVAAPLDQDAGLNAGAVFYFQES